MMASNTGTQIEKSPVTTLMSMLTTSSPPMILATPESELELRMYILSVVTTFDWKSRLAHLLAIAICRPVRDRTPCFCGEGIGSSGRTRCVLAGAGGFHGSM